MEPLTPAKRLTAMVAAATLVVTAGFVAYRQLTEKPLGQLTRAGLPMLDLAVQLTDADGNVLPAEGSRVANGELAPEGDERCPALSGGDIASATAVDASVPRAGDCPRRAAWYIKKHPVALTLHFNDGAAFLSWWDRQPRLQALADDRFVHGLFFGLLQSLKVRAEQLNLDGLQGEFLQQLLRDALGADAELHYDMAHASQGWVLSYRRSASRYSDRAMPALAGLLAASGYRVGKLPQPILETRIGPQKLFFTEYHGRVYLAQGLEALLNVIDSVAPETEVGAAPLSLTLRAEAFVGHLLPVLVGEAEYPLRWDFTLTEGELGVLQLPPAIWQTRLHDQLFEGVLASIPHDAFAGVAASLALPPTWTLDDWRGLASDGPATALPSPEPTGIALIWDFNADSPAGAVGVVVANPGQPQASAAYAQYLKNPDLGAECAGGSLFLAASSESLLTRMKDACARQSLSPLDWQRGAEKSRWQAAQLAAFVNPGAGIRELFLAGGAGETAQDSNEFAPRWQQDYANAKAAMRRDGDKLFAGLPIFSYAGRADTNGARLTGRLLDQ